MGERDIQDEGSGLRECLLVQEGACRKAWGRVGLLGAQVQERDEALQMWVGDLSFPHSGLFSHPPFIPVSLRTSCWREKVSTPPSPR